MPLQSTRRDILAGLTTSVLPVEAGYIGTFEGTHPSNCEERESPAEGAQVTLSWQREASRKRHNAPDDNDCRREDSKPSSTLAAVLVDLRGKPAGKRRVTVKARPGDGPENRLTIIERQPRTSLRGW